MADLTKTTVYKLTLKDEYKKNKGVWMPNVIKLQANEMNELVQMGEVTYDKFYTIKPSMIEQVKRVTVQECTEREHRFTNLIGPCNQSALNDELTPQEVLSIMTDTQIIEEEVTSCPTVEGLKSIVDGIITHNGPTASHEAKVSVMNSVPRMNDTIEKTGPPKLSNPRRNYRI